MATTRKRMTRAARKDKNAPYKSGLEQRIAASLWANDRNVVYEPNKISYTIPASKHSYTPDFQLSSTVYIEGKGRLLPAERKKHLLVKEQNPDIEIKFFFENADKPIYKGSPTSYGDWCDRHGFDWTDLKRGLPKEWIK